MQVHSRRRFGQALTGLIGGCLLAAPGCAAPKRTFESPVDLNRMSDLEFTHYLATVPVATVDEGYRATLLLTGDSTRWPTFPERREELIRRGAVRRRWNLEPDATLDKGTLAHLLRVMGGLPPSINERLWGRLQWGDRRYALDTCIYEKIMPPSRAGEAVTGGELLTAINQTQERLDRLEAKP